MPELTIEERKKRLFNIIVEHVMPEVHNLKTIYDNSGGPTADAISKSLDNLRSMLFMGVTSYGSFHDTSSNDLSTIDKMLDAKLCVYSEGYYPAQEDAMCEYPYVEGGYEMTGFSLRETLESSRFKTLLKTVERSLARLDIESILSINPHSITTINNSIYSTRTNAFVLCKLASIGDLAAISKLTFTNQQINQLVSNAVIGDPPSFLGKYNALMMAASYRHLDVVKYFIEVSQADVGIKGGRRNNYTALDCAKQKWWFAVRPNADLILYLSLVSGSTNTQGHRLFDKSTCQNSSLSSQQLSLSKNF